MQAIKYLPHPLNPFHGKNEGDEREVNGENGKSGKGSK